MDLRLLVSLVIVIGSATPSRSDDEVRPVPPRNAPHWAYRPVLRPHVPPVSDAASAENAIDRFVTARLHRARLSMNPPATPAVLLRRVSLDLIGLPPSLSEIDAFVADPRPDAFSRVVDRLLASPYYGEHWGRYWLDLARYADTNGYNIDVPRPIWPYRDWVIGALNADMPFDQFTIEQIAGDLLRDASRAQIIATGFHRNTMINQEGGVDPEEDRVKAIVDRVSTTATIWLGTTLACSQCHDHLYDPFPQRDFFGLYAFFNNTEDVAGGGPNTSLAPLVLLTSPEQQAELDRIRHALSKLDAKQTEALAKLRAAQAALLKSVPSTMVLKERAQRRTTRLHIRGDLLNLGDEVTPGVPSALHPLRRSPESGSRPNRLDLARWLVASDNPLAGRVTMNRHWQRFFGTGLVATSDDFGTRGERPSHPGLLDWLADEFVAAGWRIKRMHHSLVTSKTYRQSSRAELATRRTAATAPYQTDHGGLQQIDHLLARGPRFRLDSETIRDIALVASGLWNRQIGGPSVYPIQPAGFWLEFGTRGFGMERWPTGTGGERYRRGVYTFWRRTSVYPTFAIFDAPSREQCTVRRPRSNTPLQALSTLNDPAFIACAVALALRTMRSDVDSVSDRIVYAFRLCVSRRPRTSELARLVLLHEQLWNHYRDRVDHARALVGSTALAPVDDVDSRELAAWTMLASVLLNLDETITKG